MYKKLMVLASLVGLLGACSPLGAARANKGHAGRKKEEFTHAAERAELWRAPRNIASRNLFFGPGGKEHAPDTTYTFIEEDMHGTNPKFQVRDENGTKWRVKLGVEAHTEPSASRLLWAVGYSTNQFYFVPEIKVEGLPAHLHRGQNLVRTHGTLLAVELRRHVKGEKKAGIWRWRDNPFVGTREFNGLRVMMALVNNWDVKDDNNGIYKVDGGEDEYRVSDLGGSFGTNGVSWAKTMSKSNLLEYRRSTFISNITSDHVDFGTPGRASLNHIFNPIDFVCRLQDRWIGRGIPRADARWLGALLAQLSLEQIRDAFRAGGYSPDQVEAYARIIEARIRELNEL